MSEAAPVVERSTLGLHALEQYEPLIGTEVVERIANKADRIRTQCIVHVSASFYGGGVSANVGGIRRQIKDGENGFLVESIDQAADRIVEILRNPSLRERLGARAKETVRERF